MLFRSMDVTTPPLYALAHGRQWMALPARRSRSTLALPSCLLARGEPLWLPGLTLAADRSAAWVTTSLAVAEERRRLVWQTSGIVSHVRRVG